MIPPPGVTVPHSLKFFSEKDGLVIVTDLNKDYSLLMETSDGGKSWREIYRTLPPSKYK